MLKNIAAFSFLFGSICVPAMAEDIPNSQDNYDRHIEIFNSSDYQINSIFYAVPGKHWYTRDLLGTRVINPDYSETVLVDDGSGRCTFWVRAVTRSGSTKWEELVNVCMRSTLHLGD